MGGEYAFGDRKCAGGGGVIDDEQQSTVSFGFGDEGPRLDLVVG